MDREGELTMRQAFIVAVIFAVATTAATAMTNRGAPGAMLYPDGSSRFAYGGMLRPSIYIQAGSDCDIALQDGEKIHDVFISDSARWKISTGWSGPDVGHVVVKPTDVNLRTALTIMTDRRTYHIDLVSTRGAGAEFVGFYYPATPAELRARIAAHDAKVQPRYACTNLDGAYTAQGATSLRPISVCNDGKQTYVNMPILSGDLPIVKQIGADGKDAQATYTFDNTHNEYAVDGTPARLVLIRGRDRIVLARTTLKTTASTADQVGGRQR
jgi:type IV secretion system protein VirB9